MNSCLTLEIISLEVLCRTALKRGWFSQDVRGARGLFIVESSGEVMAVARKASPRSVVLIKDADSDGKAEKVIVLAEEATLTHGLVVRDKYIGCQF